MREQLTRIMCIFATSTSMMIMSRRCMTHAFQITPFQLSMLSKTNNNNSRYISSKPINSSTTHLFSTTSGSSSGGRVSNAVNDSNLISKTKTTSSESNTNPNETTPPTKLDTNPPKGTRDFYPEDMRLRTWLFSHFRFVAQTYGFSEYDAPILESEALYTRKAGEEVVDQLYNFEDKGNRKVALRPEMTPSLARMVMAQFKGLNFPLKWFSIPQCWRYERMTRGRRREHFQWNMDIWGVDGVEAEVELLSAMVTFFERVGLTSDDVGIKVNSRGVISEVLRELGIPDEKFAATCVLVDKLEKVPIEAIQDDLEALGLDKSVVEKLLSILSNKSLESLIQSLNNPNSQSIQQLQKLLSLCQSYGISDWIIFDASVVRGLAYYTGIVFEAFDRKGVLRAIAGGGRYDKLLHTLSNGEKSTSAIGFGFGDAVIVELLKERNILPNFEGGDVDSVIFAMNEELYGPCIEIATKLRKLGQRVDLVLEQKKTKWVFKHADRLKANFVFILGSDEYNKGEVSIKNLLNGEQTSVKINELDQWVDSQPKNN